MRLVTRILTGIVSTCFASSMLLALPAVASAQILGEPTTIGASPYSQVADGCPSATARWNITLGGGESGQWKVKMSRGDGTTSPWTYTYSSSIAWSHPYYDAYCGSHFYHQYWTASRAGGIDGHDDSYVTIN